MSENRNPMGTAPINELIIKYSVPAIIGMVVNALYNIVDRIYIGNAPELGANGLAGVTIGFPIMIFQMAITILFGVGGATLFSMRLGEGKLKEATKALNTSVVMLLIVGVIFVITGHLFLFPILRMFGASEVILPYSAEYMRIIFFGSIFQMIGMGLNHFLRADGQPKLAMIRMLISAGINIILDPIFIYYFKMGMAGAALATVISQFFAMVWSLMYFMNRDNTHHIRMKGFKLEFSEVRKIISLGLPGFFTQLGNSVLNLMLNRSLLQYGGDIAVSGMGVINSVSTFLTMPIVGINQGIQPIISFNFGAKKVKRIFETERIAIITATIVMILGWLIINFFPEMIIGVFSRDADLVRFTKPALLHWLMCLPVVGFQVLGANFFQAIGRSKSAMFLTLSRQLIFLIPAIVIFSSLWGLDGVLYAAPFADALAFIITAITYYFGIKDLRKLDY